MPGGHGPWPIRGSIYEGEEMAPGPYVVPVPWPIRGSIYKGEEILLILCLRVKIQKPNRIPFYHLIENMMNRQS